MDVAQTVLVILTMLDSSRTDLLCVPWEMRRELGRQDREGEEAQFQPHPVPWRVASADPVGVACLEGVTSQSYSGLGKGTGFTHRHPAAISEGLPGRNAQAFLALRKCQWIAASSPPLEA